MGDNAIMLYKNRFRNQGSGIATENVFAGSVMDFAKYEQVYFITY